MAVTIQTERLTLRPMESTDADVLYNIYQTEGVLRYFPPIKNLTLERMLGYVERQQQNWDKYGYGHWGIVPKDETQIIGWVGLQFLPELGETEVGYLLNKPHWGKGYATEAALASIQFGFEKHGLDHIIALVHPENLASRHVVEKCNMTYVETIHLWEIDLMRHILTQNVTKKNNKPA